MLPDFPKIKSARADRLNKAAYLASLQRHPILAKLRGVVQHEGSTYQFGDGKGPGTRGYESLQAEMAVDLTTLRDLNNQQLFKLFISITDQFVAEQMRLFMRRIAEASELPDPPVVAGRGEPNETMLLDLLEKSELDFEGDQVASGFAFLVSPTVAERIQNIKQSPEGQRRHDEIIQRKRLDWRLREADRKLVD